MFLRQSTCTSQDCYAYMEMTFLSLQTKLEIKIWKISQNLGQTKLKKNSKLKLVIRPKSRQILLTFDQEDLFLAENILASLKWKDSSFFSCLYRKITHLSQ